MKLDPAAMQLALENALRPRKRCYAPLLLAICLTFSAITVFFANYRCQPIDAYNYRKISALVFLATRVSDEPFIWRDIKSRTGASRSTEITTCQVADVERFLIGKLDGSAFSLPLERNALAVAGPD